MLHLFDYFEKLFLILVLHFISTEFHFQKEENQNNPDLCLLFSLYNLVVYLYKYPVSNSVFLLKDLFLQKIILFFLIQFNS